MSTKIDDAQVNHASHSPRLDIQGLRALAVLGVIIFHAGVWLPGGFAGVDVFFVVSGFVITGMLQREFAKSNRVHLGRFYARRFRRLAPALALMVAFTLVVAAFLQSPLGPAQVTAKTALGATTGTANLVINIVTGGYFAAAAETNPLLHTWSLSVEEQFYLIFPALLVGGFWLARRRWTSGLYIPVVILALLSVILTTVSVAGLNILAKASF